MVNQEHDVVMTFHSTHQAMTADKVLKDQNIYFDLIPTPRQISAGCGLSLILKSDEVAVWLNLLTEANITYGGIYICQGEVYEPWEGLKSEG